MRPVEATLPGSAASGVTLSRQLHDDPRSRDCHAYARRGEKPAALANKIDHIIKSPPLMSKDAPVM